MGLEADFASGETIDLDSNIIGEEEMGDTRIRLSSDFMSHQPRIYFASQIGSGTFGHVFKAKATPLYNGTEAVAVKVMKKGLLKQGDDNDLKDLKKRFMNECVMQYILSHQLPDKIVKVYDYGEFMDNRFMVMELMSDKSLREVIDSNRDFELIDRTKIMIDIANTLGDVHEKGFVHRDFKPENALFSKGTYIIEGEIIEGKKTKKFTGERVIKLTDFGLIRWIQAHSSEEERKIVGSPHYMSPEQIESPKTVDHRTDIYSFGVVFYELLTGTYPRKVVVGKSKADTLVQLARSDIQPILDLNPKVKKLVDVVMKCMAKHPANRYSSMDEVLSKITDYKEKFLD